MTAGAPVVQAAQTPGSSAAPDTQGHVFTLQVLAVVRLCTAQFIGV